jgi:hypothetical protein
MGDVGGHNLEQFPVCGEALGRVWPTVNVVSAALTGARVATRVGAAAD